jgi:tetratricopeptide (TPR) repeat protein
MEFSDIILKTSVKERTMRAARVFIWLLPAVGFTGFISAASAQTYSLIVRGKVTMQDGTPLPKPVGIQTICSDLQGSAPGPLTDKKGDYLWRMDVDPMRTRVCYLSATLPGYVSSRIDISNLKGYLSTTADLPPIVLRPEIPDPGTIVDSESEIPQKAKTTWKAAMKAVDAGNLQEAQKQLQTVTETSPKFARGWHTLGIIDQALHRTADARDAWQHAIDADPKFFAAYVMLARISIKNNDWPNAKKAADALIKMDTKQTYPEIYLHQAVARLKSKDLDGAESAARDAAQKYQIPRAEFVLGRVAEAKGDIAGAREHIAKYIAMDPTAADIEQIKAFLLVIGKPEGAGTDPNPELP